MHTLIGTYTHGHARTHNTLQRCPTLASHTHTHTHTHTRTHTHAGIPP